MQIYIRFCIIKKILTQCFAYDETWIQVSLKGLHKNVNDSNVRLVLVKFALKRVSSEHISNEG